MFFKDFNFYILKDSEWLQNIIREKLDPTEVFQKEGYTSQDIIDYFIINQERGILEFLGSPEAKFCYRLFYPNDRVVEPHVMGDIKYLRTFTEMSVDFMFVKNNIEKINMFSHLPAMIKVAERNGFKREGVLTNTYLLKGELIDVYVLGLNKQDYYKNKGK